MNPFPQSQPKAETRWPFQRVHQVPQFKAHLKCLDLHNLNLSLLLIKASLNTNTVHIKHQEIMHLILFTSAHFMIICYLHFAQPVHIRIIRNRPECTPIRTPHGVRVENLATRSKSRDFHYWNRDCLLKRTQGWTAQTNTGLKGQRHCWLAAFPEPARELCRREQHLCRWEQHLCSEVTKVRGAGQEDPPVDICSSAPQASPAQRHPRLPKEPQED